MKSFLNNTSLRIWLPLLCPALLAASWLIFSGSKNIVLDKSMPLSLELPQSVAEWTLTMVAYCQNDQCMMATEYQNTQPAKCPICNGEVDEGPLSEKLILPVDTTIKHGRYKDTNGNIIELAIVISGASKASLHRPEWCLPGQGYNITVRESLTIDGDQPFMVNLFELDRITRHPSAMQEKGFFLYWFVGPSMETAYRRRMLIEMTKERVFENKAYRWAYIAILTPQRNSKHVTLDYTKRFASAIRDSLYDPRKNKNEYQENSTTPR